jgi:hypothetical protein
MVTCYSKYGLNIDWALFVLKCLPILSCNMVNLELCEVYYKPQQVAFVSLKLLKMCFLESPVEFCGHTVYLYEFFQISVLLACYFYCCYSAHKSE